MDCTVKLNMEQMRFHATVDGRGCYLQFNTDSEEVFEMDYIFVHPKVRERGVASELLRSALVFAQKEGIKVVPGCDFVFNYLNKHPEYTSVVQEVE